MFHNQNHVAAGNFFFYNSEEEILRLAQLRATKVEPSYKFLLRFIDRF